MVILVVFKGFLLVKNLEFLVQIVPDRSVYSYLGKLVLESLISKYDEMFARSSSFIASVILFKCVCSLLLLF